MKSWLSYFNSIAWNFFPPTRLFSLKRWMLIQAGAKVGINTKIASSSRILISGDLHIGANTWVGHEVLFLGGDAPIIIGSDCDIAPRVAFVTGTHEIETVGPKAAGKGHSLPISIGDGCWICAGATILGGTAIGDQSIVAAGAVVKGEFPPGSLIGGVPAKLIKSLRAVS